MVGAGRQRYPPDCAQDASQLVAVLRRLGRKTRLLEAQRERLWRVFAWVRAELQSQGW